MQGWIKRLDGEIKTLSQDLENLSIIITPGNAEEILTAARLQQEIRIRADFEQRVNMRLDEVDISIVRNSETISSIQFWIWGTLLIIIIGLLTSILFLARKIATLLKIILPETLSDSH